MKQEMPPTIIQKTWWIGRISIFRSSQLTIAQPRYSWSGVTLERNAREISVDLEEIPQIIEVLTTILKEKEESHTSRSLE